MESFEDSILNLQREKIARMKSCEQPYEVEVLGKYITVLPGVFCPATDTKLMISSLRLQPREIVLEACAGTGAISVFAAEKAKEVVATDINPNAVKNILENARRHGLERKITAIQADLFPCEARQFDAIIINPPYTDNKPCTIEELAFWDEGHQAVKRFFEKASGYLKDAGRIYFSWANFAGFEVIENLAKKYGFSADNISEKTHKNEIVFRVYEIKRIK